MPIFMRYDGIDGDVASRGGTRDAGQAFATGETLVHIESSVDDSNVDDLIFGGDNSTADSSNLEILVKVLDSPANAQGETLVHVESAGWLLP